MEQTPLLTWPKVRQVRDASGREWVAVIEPGRLDLSPPPGEEPAWGALVISDPDQLRAFAMALYVAAIDYDQARALPPPGQGRAHLKRQRARAAPPGGSGRRRDRLL